MRIFPRHRPASVCGLFLTLAWCWPGLITPAQAPARASGPAQTNPRPQGWTAIQQSQAWATQRLATSPRRSEWVTVPHGERKLRGWVVFPSGHRKGPVVLVLHEVFGLTDSTRNTADEIAALGYIAITPDMLSGRGPGGGNSDSFTTSQRPSPVTQISDEQINSDLNAWADYAAKLPGSNGTFVLVGLSWGGGAAFRYATSVRRNDLKAVFVFYDVGPPAETQHFDGAPSSVSVDAVAVPVYGFYPGKDTRVMAGLSATREAMARAGKRFVPVVYPDAEHAYMRVGDDPANTNPANAAARKASLEHLRQLLATM